MEFKTLVKIINQHGEGREDSEGAHIVGDSRIVTLYINMGGEALMVSEVKSIALVGGVVVATTRKEEVFAMDAHDVKTVRIKEHSEKRRTGLIR